jgi:hypothetical protein
VGLHIDLAAGSVAGKPILGQTVAIVRSELGTPDYVERYPKRIDLGYGPKSAPRVEVIFNGTAWAMVFYDQADVDARLGPLLTVPPRTLQQRFAQAYKGLFRLTRSYHCDPKGCFGLFVSADGLRRVIFGISDGRRYIGLQLT